MAGKYRRYRKYRKRPRFHRKFKRYSRVGRTKAIRVHYFKRTMVEDILIRDKGFTSGGTLGSSFSSKLNDLPAASEFIALYDTYKICGIKKKFVFTKSSADVDGDATNELPTLITVNDFNDSDNLVNEDQALQYASYKARRLDKIVSRYYRPCLMMITNSITANSLSSKSRWLSTASPDVDHFGMKWAIDTIGITNTVSLGHLRVYTTYYIAFMGPK